MTKTAPPIRNDEAGRKAIEEIFKSVLDSEGLLSGRQECAKGVYLTAFEARNPAWVFVPDPTKRGRYCRVPRAYLYVGCPACGALPGQPCWSPNHGTSWSGQTGHADIRRVLKVLPRERMPTK